MTSSEETLTQSLSAALASKSAGPEPGFNETWLAAESRFLTSKRRYRQFTGIAVSLALVAVVIGMLPADENTEFPNFEVVAEIMNDTNWTAPSDILMPEYSIDVYDDLPRFPRPTELYEGVLL